MIATVTTLWMAATTAQAVSPADTDAWDEYRRTQQAFRIALRRVEPSVVTIETVGGTVRPDIVGSGPIPDVALADGPTTGLIHSADGLILTSAFNFVRDPSVITVTLSDGRSFVARMLARDDIHKLVMLRIDADDLPAARWCDASEVHVGAWALAIGRGFVRESSSLSAGIVSALERFEGRAVQTDAKLSPANYGGPLIDLDGRVIGICVPMAPGGGDMAGVGLYDSGVGFAVPGWRIRVVAERLARGESVRRGWIGVRIDAAESGGVQIMSVAPGSPAEVAELQANDVITFIDDVAINTLADLRHTMAVRAAGDVIDLTVRRDSETLHRPVTLRHLSEIEGLAPPPTQPSP